MYRFLLVSLLLQFYIVSSGVHAQGAGKFLINISGIQTATQGDLLIYVYDEKTWLEQEQALRMRVLEHAGHDQYQISFNDLPAGEYAIQVTHDSDNNGKLSMGLFGPSEGVGVSQYVPSFIPSFDKAKFSVKSEGVTLVPVVMSY